MRTTLTIDDDIAVRLAEIRAEDGERFKTLLNRVLRAGLAALRAEKRREPASAFSTKTYPAKCLLPEGMAEIFRSIKSDYTQTCSKSEQLALALFMEDGYYTANIRRLRTLYSQKLQAAVSAFERYGKGTITPMNTKSGISMILELESPFSVDELCRRAESIGLHAAPLAGAVTEAAAPAEGPPEAGSEPETEKKRRLIFYYNQIPLERIDELLSTLCIRWEI